MTAKQLLYFVTIAETGSFTLAAEKLSLSQPPLSKQIMLLENELNTQLLIRSSRRIKLTESGVMLYTRAKDILRMMDSAAADLNSHSGKVGGTVRFGVVHSTGDLILNQRLNTYFKEYPQVTLDLYESDTCTLLDHLRSGKLDAAIVEMPFDTQDLDCRILPEDSFAAVGRPEHLPEDLRSVTVNDLIGRPLVYCRSNEHAILSEFEEAGLPLHCLCKTCDVRTALRFACSGHGVAIVPKHLALEAVHHEVVRVLPLDAPHLKIQLAFVCKKNMHRCRAIEALAQLF